MKTIIFLKGGLVQEVIAEEPMEVLIIDEDCESSDDYETLTDVMDNQFDAKIYLSSFRKAKRVVNFFWKQYERITKCGIKAKP